jgi:hypothetical protein
MSLRYKNIFSGEMVTIKENPVNPVDSRYPQPIQYISYRRDNALISEFGARMYEFTKPAYVFNQCYKPVSDSTMVVDATGKIGYTNSTWV